MEALMARADIWHRRRFPNAQQEHVALKMAEEVGEVASAINAGVGFNSATGKGDVGPEIADVFITGFILLSRWFPNINLREEIEKKLTLLETPGLHPSSIDGVKDA